MDIFTLGTYLVTVFVFFAKHLRYVLNDEEKTKALKILLDLALKRTLDEADNV